MTSKWNYSGDMNLEYGGFYWQWDGGPDYVNAVQVTPCGDAGGPANLFYIETGSIYLPQDVKARNSALDCIGYEARPEELGALVEALCAYSGIERGCSHDERYVRIGKPEDARRDGWNPAPDVTLRAGAKLANWVKREYLA